ncbi:lumazine-binding protein [Flavobacterium ardleyense]|uniref:Lumazine-binding protein n=1 Tax=Flavobacterium ardleyense TaxID=2038737 RepID=A0ABW5Z3S4_9FLAO
MKQIKKKAISLLKVVLVLALFTNVACSDKSEVENVANKFLTHLNKLEFKEAKEYCDDKTAPLLGMLESFSAMAGKTDEKIAEFKITGSEVKDDKATVTYTQMKDGETKEETLNLKKIDGKWKVSMNKEDAKKEEGKKSLNESVEVEESEPFIFEDDLNDSIVVE